MASMWDYIQNGSGYQAPVVQPQPTVSPAVPTGSGGYTPVSTSNASTPAGQPIQAQKTETKTKSPTQALASGGGTGISSSGQVTSGASGTTANTPTSSASPTSGGSTVKIPNLATTQSQEHAASMPSQPTVSRPNAIDVFNYIIRGGAKPAGYDEWAKYDQDVGNWGSTIGGGSTSNAGSSNTRSGGASTTGSSNTGSTSSSNTPSGTVSYGSGGTNLTGTAGTTEVKSKKESKEEKAAKMAAKSAAMAANIATGSARSAGLNAAQAAMAGAQGTQKTYTDTEQSAYKNLLDFILGKESGKQADKDRAERARQADMATASNVIGAILGGIL